MVGANGVNGNDGGRMRHGDVGNPLLHTRVRRYTNKELEFRVGGREPKVCDQAREHDSAHWIDPPLELTPTDRSEETKAVDKKVIAVILPEDAYLRIDVTQCPAVAEEREFGNTCDGHCYYRGQM